MFLGFRTWRVYPRVGGETSPPIPPTLRCLGLSPRGRGNRKHVLTIHLDPGSIPAWAGKPAEPAAPRASARVYPRVGGETAMLDVQCGGNRGLSPRGRGNLPGVGEDLLRQGSIPAWAGKPVALTPPEICTRVYPRVGGETYGAVEGRRTETGLSPRGRGNRGEEAKDAAHQGSIPAWAGKPGRPSPPRPTAAVYPRVGGETFKVVRTNGWVRGLSPRGRGNLTITNGVSGRIGSIPAWAGKP